MFGKCICACYHAEISRSTLWNRPSLVQHLVYPSWLEAEQSVGAVAMHKSLIALLFVVAAAQAQNPSLTAIQIQGMPTQQLLVNVSGLSSEQFRALFEKGPGGKLSSYQMYVIDKPDEPE